MLVRKPASDVFEAIVNPAITSRFWFTKGSGRLEKGKRVQWEWEMYGISAQVNVLEVEPSRRVLVEWATYGQPATRVEWQLASRKTGTYVTVTQSGFEGTPDEIVRKALDSTGGFSFHLAGMKAWLEHGLELNLTGDRHSKD
jgi:uncharacterized protein YndB with AHSA1/START domain